MFFKFDLLTSALSLIFLVESSVIAAEAEDRSSTTISLYGGPSSPTPLLNLVRLNIPELASFYNITTALNRGIWTDSRFVALELEGSVAFQLESIQNTAFQGATLIRWLEPPSNKVFKSSVALGMGVSYAINPPEIEIIVLPKTANLLMHVLIEFAADLDLSSTWQGLFRIHHRSGAYGLFSGVVGGSDYLCLGIRYRI